MRRFIHKSTPMGNYVEAAAWITMPLPQLFYVSNTSIVPQSVPHLASVSSGMESS